MSTMRRPSAFILVLLAAVLLIAFLPVTGPAQSAARSKAESGSLTARNGFRNESEIAAKFNDWQSDADALGWLKTMGYRSESVRSVNAVKPHGEKSDVELKITSDRGETLEGISIKLVSSPNGFNQIDKRWLDHYRKMWNIPPDVFEPLKLFVGETKPAAGTRKPDRMLLNELDPAAQRRVIEFFSAHKDEIVSDLLKGNGVHAAGWLMVALKSGEKPKWVIRKMDDAIRFFGDGSVTITRGGNLKMGRITMQRKGGDAGRDTAKMLQFKINPAELFDAK
jgi:hypothetical protein